MCSAWCVTSWLGAPPAERIYYPIIIALGAFSTAYCVSSARVGAMSASSARGIIAARASVE